MLADLLCDGPLPVAEALRFSVGLAEALRRIHEQGSIYGMLDPSRVSVDGNAVELLPAGHRAQISHYYSAPEQLQGTGDDPRSDVFALGAVLYEMLTGRKAFPNGSRGGPPPFEGIPPAFSHLLGKCLEIRPERRLQRVQLALIQLRLLQATNGRSNSSPAPEPRPKAIPLPHPIHPFQEIRIPPPPGQGICPTCRSTDVRQSRPKNGLEESLEGLGARFNRCYRCYHRFMRLAFITFKRPG